MAGTRRQVSSQVGMFVRYERGSSLVSPLLARSAGMPTTHSRFTRGWTWRTGYKMAPTSDNATPPFSGQITGQRLDSASPSVIFRLYWLKAVNWPKSCKQCGTPEFFLDFWGTAGGEEH